MVARASANETEHRLNTAKDCGLGPAERIDEILGWNNETIRMIASTISTLRAGQASRKIGDSSTDYQTDTEINDV